jgi:two-component system response regulator FixJ
MPDRRVVHVVDDDAAFRGSLEALLESARLTAVTYESAAAVIDSSAQLTEGCLLLDIHMPGMNGLELQTRLTALGVRLPVIVMTGQGNIPTAVQAMKAGAVDFIEKPFDDRTLIVSIEAALIAGIERESREHSRGEATARIAALTPRERQVLEGIVLGRASKVIAYDLGISVRTVEVHRTRMLERLGTRSVAAAIRLAVMAGLASGQF